VRNKVTYSRIINSSTKERN